jgi:hypothetical protein
MMKFALVINGMTISFSRLENDKKMGYIFVWVGDYVIMHFSPNDYDIKYKFKGSYSDSWFFELVKR